MIPKLIWSYLLEYKYSKTFNALISFKLAIDDLRLFLFLSSGNIFMWADDFTNLCKLKVIFF